MYIVLNTIIIGIIATFIYELGKYLLFYIIDNIKVRNLPFTLSGYWCSYVNYIPKNSTDKFEAYELIKLKYKKETVYIKMYQLTNDNRKNYYEGRGFLRGNKLAFAYKEIHRTTSNQVGTIILRYRNLKEHEVFLVGNYHEFRHDNYRSSSNPYMIKKYNMKFIDRFKSMIFHRKNIFSIMQSEGFKNECKNMPKMR